MNTFKLMVIILLLNSNSGIAQARTENMLNFFDGIVETFQATYAPEPWKEQEYGITINGIAGQIREEISTNNPSKKEFQIYLKRFFDAFKDYHVYYDFVSTESASLPFKAMHINGKIYITSIDRSKLLEFNKKMQK